MRKKRTALTKLGKKIRELRLSQGYSQENFAYEVGLERSYYGGIERGEYNVAAINLMKIAKTLNVEVGELFPSIRSISFD